METTKAAISTVAQTSRAEKLDVNGMEFVSIKDEFYRTYTFPSGQYTIDKPQWLFVRQSKAHLVIDSAGITHYVPNTFIGLLWSNRGDIQANF